MKFSGKKFPPHITNHKNNDNICAGEDHVVLFNFISYKPESNKIIFLVSLCKICCTTFKLLLAMK